MLPGAPLRPRQANQGHRGQYPSHTVEGLSLCRADAHLYTLGHPIREEVGDFIALCKQRLQRVTGSKPSKSTNTLPPTWQFSLSWGAASANEEPRVLGRQRNQAARVQRDALLASFLLGSPPPKTLRGVKLADSTLCTISLGATLSPRGTMRRTATKPGTDAMVRHLNAPSG